MPIRFRCAYCNQLMAIAQRKSGTIVKCPRCTGELIVPTPVDESSSDKPALTFDNDDLSKYLEKTSVNAPISAAGSTAGGSSAAGSTTAWAPPDAQQLLSAAPAPPAQRHVPPIVGVTLSFLTLAMLLIVVVFLIGAAFVVGYLLGAHWRA